MDAAASPVVFEHQFATERGPTVNASAVIAMLPREDHHAVHGQDQRGGI
jgi:hypothetical protein